jgi:hypothetical protein
MRTGAQIVKLPPDVPASACRSGLKPRIDLINLENDVENKGKSTMKGVWFSLVALAVGVAGLVSVAPSIAQAAGVTKAQVLAGIAGHRALTMQPKEPPQPLGWAKTAL